MGKFTKYNHFRVTNLVIFSTFTLLCKHHLYLVPKYFYYPKGNSMLIKQLFAISPLVPAFQNHQYTFCLYEFTYCGYFI